MLYDCKRISYRIDRRLTGLAGPDYDAPISFGLPFEPEDSQYGKYRSTPVSPLNHRRQPLEQHPYGRLGNAHGQHNGTPRFSATREARCLLNMHKAIIGLDHAAPCSVVTCSVQSPQMRSVDRGIATSSRSG